MLKDKKAVIFDLDGTLVDSMWVWYDIDVEFLGKYGHTVPEDLQKEIEGMGFTEVAVYFKKRFSLPDTIEEIKSIWQNMAMEAYVTKVPLKPGLRSFLAFLYENKIPMAVASSNDYKLIDNCLKGHGIRDYFSCIVTACDVSRGKPAPDVYLEAARQLSVDPVDCLVFEDIVPGILAGKNAGCTVCAVKDAYSVSQEKEKRACADYFISSYGQITDGTYEVL